MLPLLCCMRNFFKRVLCIKRFFCRIAWYSLLVNGGLGSSYNIQLLEMDMKKFNIIAPFSDEVFEDIYPNWLFWNAEKQIQCHMEDLNTLVFDTSPLPSNHEHVSINNMAIGCFLFVHKSFGVLYCTCSFSKSSLVMSNPKIAFNRERAAFRLGYVDNVIEEDVSVINMSSRGCLLDCESKVGSVRFFNLNMKKKVKIIAFCVHTTNGKSGWCFPLWMYEDEKYYRLALGKETIPPLAQLLQYLSAQQTKITVDKQFNK